MVSAINWLINWLNYPIKKNIKKICFIFSAQLHHLSRTKSELSDCVELPQTFLHIQEKTRSQKSYHVWLYWMFSKLVRKRTVGTVRRRTTYY